MQRKAAGAWKREPRFFKKHRAGVASRSITLLSFNASPIRAQEFVAQRLVRFQAASPQTKFGASMLGPSEGGTSLAHNWVAMSRASASAEALGDVLDDVIVLFSYLQSCV